MSPVCTLQAGQLGTDGDLVVVAGRPLTTSSLGYGSVGVARQTRRLSGNIRQYPAMFVVSVLPTEAVDAEQIGGPPRPRTLM
jgi:hypothetical protein